jgi:hypothetical protein
MTGGEFRTWMEANFRVQADACKALGIKQRTLTDYLNRRDRIPEYIQRHIESLNALSHARYQYHQLADSDDITHPC